MLRSIESRLLHRSGPASARACAAALTVAVAVAAGAAAPARAVPAVALGAPSDIRLTPGSADPTCNGGKGIRVTRPASSYALVTGGVLADGTVVVATSSGSGSAALIAVTADCAPDRAFGRSGIATVTVPPGVLPAGKAPPIGSSEGALWLSVVTARATGGAIVAGTSSGRWVVGEIDAHGRLDRRFGTGGLAVLPYPGQVTAVVEEPSGRLLVAGDDGGGGCCIRNWLAALSPAGQVERAFGTRGRTALSTRGHSGVHDLSVAPGGGIVAQLGYGNNGCWGVDLVRFTPSGRPVAGFSGRLARFWQGLGFNAFVGSATVDADGITLTGIGQSTCWGYGPPEQANPRSITARFRGDGTLVRRTLGPAPSLPGWLTVVREGDRTIVAQGQYAHPQLELTARRSDGSIDTRFGSRGHATARAPWHGLDAELATILLLLPAGPRGIVIAAAKFDGTELHISRLRT